METLKARKNKNLFLAAMIGASILIGISDSMFASVKDWQRLSFMISTLFFAFCTTFWCHYDSIVQNYDLKGRLRLTILLITVIGFPIYAFKSRGRAGWKLLFSGFLFFITSTFLQVGAESATDLLK
jgi:hypothetical protein